MMQYENVNVERMQEAAFVKPFERTAREQGGLGQPGQQTELSPEAKIAVKRAAAATIIDKNYKISSQPEHVTVADIESLVMAYENLYADESEYSRKNRIMLALDNSNPFKMSKAAGLKVLTQQIEASRGMVSALEADIRNKTRVESTALAEIAGIRGRITSLENAKKDLSEKQQKYR